MRLINRVLAAVLSLALIALGVLIVAEVVAYRVFGDTALFDWHPLYHWSTQNTWNTGLVRVVCGAAIIVGLILLLAELKPPRVSRISAEPSEAGAKGIDTAYTRRGVAAAVRSAISGLDGVRSASVKVRRRRVAVTVTSVFLDKPTAQKLRDSIESKAKQRLADLRLQHGSSVSVHVNSRSR